MVRLLTTPTSAAPLSLPESRTHREYTLDSLCDLYRTVSDAGHVFVIQLDGVAIGECWIQAMNMQRLIDQFPGRRLWRIDLSIGRKQLWGRGLGTRAIRLLTRFGFDELGADAIFAVDVYDFNSRSLAAFRRVGFRTFEVHPTDSPTKGGEVDYTLILEADAVRVIAG